MSEKFCALCQRNVEAKRTIIPEVFFIIVPIFAIIGIIIAFAQGGEETLTIILLLWFIAGAVIGTVISMIISLFLRQEGCSICSSPRLTYPQKAGTSSARTNCPHCGAKVTSMDKNCPMCFKAL